MADQILKDRTGRRIGVIKTDTRGIQTLYDDVNRRKGTYDPKTNTTRDDLNRTVGTGNLLASLL